ncbi:MAG: nucleotide exchange factor GrpE [Treponema sp.]|jgi:molecular chaperone GrpE|nr:nucleotide exchange factor GrpE [Treponema sp.]
MSKHHHHRGREEAAPEEAQNGAGNVSEKETGGQTEGQNPAAEGDSVSPGADVRANSAEEGLVFPESGVETQAERPAECTPEEKIAELEAQLAETRDQLLRKAADFENFRKRMNQEKQSAIEFANQSLLLDLIPIIDDFERAIQSAESCKDFTALLDGITMIEKRLSGQLDAKWGLKRYNSAGEAFDPNRHEALMMEKSPDVAEPVVREDLLKGYTLKDRVIRTAKVKVIMPENPAAAEEGEGGAE